MATFESRYAIGDVLGVTHGGELAKVSAVLFAEGGSETQYWARLTSGHMMCFFESELNDDDPHKGIDG